MKNRATDALLSCGISMNQPGFLYIVDAMELFEENGAPITNMKIVYYKIAKSRKVSPNYVIENVRRSIDSSYKGGNGANWMKYFGLGITLKTNGNYLAVLWQRLKEEENG